MPVYSNTMPPNTEFSSGPVAVINNRQDPLTNPLLSTSVKQGSFGLNKPDLSSFGLIDEDGQQWLACGLEPLMPVADVAIKGTHNTANALAALALGQAAGLDMTAMLETLKTYKGLPHRCEHVATVDNVMYIDDSKGTNIGATVAALNGFGGKDRANLILIAGGQGKGQNFAQLKKPVAQFVKLLALYGEDAAKIASELEGSSEIEQFDSLEKAVEKARCQCQVRRYSFALARLRQL